MIRNKADSRLPYLNGHMVFRKIWGHFSFVVYKMNCNHCQGTDS